MPGRRGQTLESLRENVQPHMTASSYDMVVTFQCQRCPKFRVCAHVLAVAGVMGGLRSSLANWSEPTIDLAKTSLVNSGKKLGTTRKRSAASKRSAFDWTKYSDVTPTSTINEKEIVIVWLQDNPAVCVP